MDQETSLVVAPTPVVVRYAKAEIKARVLRAMAQAGAVGIHKTERVEVPEHCQCCGSPKMRNVVVVIDSHGNPWRVGSKCAAVMTGAAVIEN